MVSDSDSRGARKAFSSPAQFRWMGQNWCGLTRQEKLSVFWSALKAFSVRFGRGFSLGFLVMQHHGYPFVPSPVLKD